MSLIIYLIGFAFVIGGIAWALCLAGVGTTYVMIATVILVGIAILTGGDPYPHQGLIRHASSSSAGFLLSLLLKDSRNQKQRQ